MQPIVYEIFSLMSLFLLDCKLLEGRDPCSLVHYYVFRVGASQLVNIW